MAHQNAMTIPCPRCHAPAGQRCRSLAQSWWRRRDENLTNRCHAERKEVQQIAKAALENQ